jgi:Icc protein
MTKPFLVVQLSDPHIGADWRGVDPTAMLAAAVESVASLATPDVLVVTGDLTEAATEEQYTALKQALSPLDVPLYVLAGNHDSREAIRRSFDLPGDADEPVQYAVDLGPLRLVVLDTVVPGSDAGAFDGARREWLEAELEVAPGAPTMIAMHHPPFSTGIPAMDEIGLPAADRAALAAVVERHAQVQRVIAGHVHRTIVGEVGGRPALVAPSTYLQLELNFTPAEIEMTPEPPGFAVHALIDGNVVSHVQPVR